MAARLAAEMRSAGTTPSSGLSTSARVVIDALLPAVVPIAQWSHSIAYIGHYPVGDAPATRGISSNGAKARRSVKDAGESVHDNATQLGIWPWGVRSTMARLAGQGSSGR